MSITDLTGDRETIAAIKALFENSPPVLVEVRFPKSSTSPDWHLCGDEQELEQLLERLGPGVELHLNSVWDLKNVKREICLRK
jgi:hypothetical protein